MADQQKKYIKMYKNEEVIATKTNKGVLSELARELFREAANSQSRRFAEQVWESAIKLRDVYDNELLANESITRSIRIPTLQNVIDSYMDNQEVQSFDMSIEPADEADPNAFRKAFAIEKAIEDINDVTNEKMVEEDCLRHAFTEGVGIMYKGYVRRVGVKEVLYDNIVHVSIDPRDFYPDPLATNIYDPTGMTSPRYVFWRRRMPYSTWVLETQNNKNFYNQFSVHPTADNSLFAHTNQESNEDRAGQVMVDVYEMWNPEIEITLNGKLIKGVHAIFTSMGGDVTEHFVEQASTIPLTMYYTEKRDDSIWGVPLAFKLAPMIIKKDILLNIVMNSILVSAQAPLLIDGEAGFSKYKHKLGPKEIWELKNDRGLQMQNLVARAPLQNAAINEYQLMDNLLDNEITIASGISRRAQFLNPNELATQTKAKMQTELKRINRVMKSNIRRAKKRGVEITLEILKKYLARKMKGFDGQGNAEEKYRKIKVRGFIAVTDELSSNIPDFIPTSAKTPTMFELTEELVNINVVPIIKDKKEQDALDSDMAEKLLFFLNTWATVAKDPEEVRTLALNIGMKLGLDAEEIMKTRVVDTTSPFMKQLELIALGVMPELDEDMGVEEKQSLIDAYLKFMTTKRYKELQDSSKVLVSNMITQLMMKLREQPKSEKEKQQEAQAQQAQIQQQVQQGGVSQSPRAQNLPNLMKQNGANALAQANL